MLVILSLGGRGEVSYHPQVGVGCEWLGDELLLEISYTDGGS